MPPAAEGRARRGRRPAAFRRGVCAGVFSRGGLFGTPRFFARASFSEFVRILIGFARIGIFFRAAFFLPFLSLLAFRKRLVEMRANLV
ncbi:MAG: hypothetical protein BHW65_02775 [Verrucomicrobia bacterium CAG:312_58_20]|nr:MAG: hypothetical protein BHW65_02775 [Verrucomicrobia bacterium CAG:312_58_20]